MNAAQFKLIRVSYKLTQAQLAEKLGVTTKTIGRYERGETIPKLVQMYMNLLDSGLIAIDADEAIG